MKKEVCFARVCKGGLPEERPFVKGSIDEPACYVEFLYLRVCHQGYSVVPLDEILFGGYYLPRNSMFSSANAALMFFI